MRAIFIHKETRTSYQVLHN